MRLPSMNALRALDRVARFKSVSRAADELSLTRSAVSHQLHFLEASLGIGLTERHGRGIKLTPAGERYAGEVHRALAILEQAGQRRDDTPVSGPLSISCTPGFATFWLCRHIGRFQAAYPEVNLAIVTPRTPDDVSALAPDLFIAYGLGSWPDRWVEPLTELEFTPVCSPALLNAVGGLKSPAELKRLTLLHLVDRGDWSRWLAAAGEHGVSAHTGIVFSDMHLVQAAAIAGQGVAVGDRLISGDALARGWLVQPFGQVIQAAHAYYLVADPVKIDRPANQAFRSWLRQALDEYTCPDRRSMNP